MMKKGFIFLLFIWNSYPFATGNTATDHLQFLLGCRAEIPCQLYRSGSFKWFYKKDKQSDPIQLVFQDKNGLKHHYKLFNPRMRVLDSGVLVIDDLTEDDEGLYCCETYVQNDYWVKQHTVTIVKKEIPKETNKTFYVTEGSNFTHACPGEVTNWTFKASKTTALSNLAQRPESDFVTPNKYMHIVNVRREDAGKYSCWTSACDGRRQRLLTINLCVITAHHSEDSSVSCAVMCDTESSNSTSNVETDTREVYVDPYGSLNCTTKQMSDGYSTVNSTHAPSNTSNQTTGAFAEPEYPIHIYGTSAALTCLIVMALFICYLRRSLLPAFPVHICSSCLKGRVEEETTVIYTSVVIRGPARTTNTHMTNSDCVYSEIKV